MHVTAAGLQKIFCSPAAVTCIYPSPYDAQETHADGSGTIGIVDCFNLCVHPIVPTVLTDPQNPCGQGASCILHPWVPVESTPETVGSTIAP